MIQPSCCKGILAEPEVVIAREVKVSQREHDKMHFKYEHVAHCESDGTLSAAPTRICHADPCLPHILCLQTWLHTLGSLCRCWKTRRLTH